MRGMRKAVYWIVFVLGAASVGAYFAREPWADFQREKEMAREAEVEMRKLESERADLMKQNARVRSLAGREQLARDTGYLRDGEKPLK